MSKEKIINDFLKKGKLLSPTALQFLEDKDITEFLEKNYPGIIITEKEFVQPALRIIKNIPSLPKEITTEDFIAFYRDKYRKMQEIILSRISKDFTSLNKVDNSRKDVFAIGIVKEIRQEEEKFLVELEDMTATMPVIFEDAGDLEQDDVVAVKGIAAGKVIYGKQIFYPDMPLRQPAKGSGRACFISDLHLEEAPLSDFEKFMKWFGQQGIEYLLVAGDIGDKEAFEKAVESYCYNKTVIAIPGEMESKNYPAPPVKYRNRNIISLSNPAMIEINGIKILLLHKYGLSLLKKRHLGKPKISMKEDNLVLEEIPDIVHYGHTHEPHVSNYKSITILSSGSLLTRFMPVVVDFSTREVQQINLW